MRSLVAATLLGFASASFAQDHMPMEMSSDLFPNAPMQRAGSGTSWLPDASPMHALHFQHGSWSVMAHGAVFMRYTNQDVARGGQRGAGAVDAPNWLMIMAATPVASTGRFIGRAMVSLDRLTEGGNGYPLLFQTGESWKGEPLVDRQHPHDLLSELAVAYSYSVNDKASLFAYLGLPGEPALGPPVYMHRPSARNNPDATLGHHWQDATHVAFGVATFGVQYRDFKIDGSIFTGREPDENRFNIDRPRFDSYSIRFSLNPSASVALQTSIGFLKSPEATEPDIDVWRTTSSLLHVYPIDTEKMLETALVWGMNKPAGEKAEHSLLAESEYAVGRQSVYTRLEIVEKTGADLRLSGFEDRRFSVRAFTVGIARELFTLGDLSASFGLQGIAYPVQTDLRPLYGDTPLSIELFFKLAPPRFTAGNHSMHPMDMMP